MVSDGRYSSSDLARVVGCSRKAVRVYEAKGLLGPRGATRSRRYGPPAIDRLKLVVGLRQLDMSIDDIARLLSLHANGHNTVGEAAKQIANAVDETIRLTNERMEQLVKLRESLAASRDKLTTCAACPKTVEGCQECVSSGQLDATSRTLLLG
jgi:DNA-binding transcriptional MerR regulator